MKLLTTCLAIACLLPLAAAADELAVWSPHAGAADWISLGNAHGTDVYLQVNREGQIADITIKSGIYSGSQQLKQVNIITGYFGCPEGELPQYLDHAVSTTYDAGTHAVVKPTMANLSGDNIPVTPGSVIESAARIACTAPSATPAGS